MIRYCLLLLVFTGFSLEFRAQQADLDPAKQVDTEEFAGILRTPEDVDGRAYMYPDWQSATVFLSQGRYVSELNLNYDLLNHELLVLLDDKEYSLNPIAIDSIQVTHTQQVLVNTIILPNAEIEQLLLRIYHGNHFSLYRYTSTTVLEEGSKTGTEISLVYTDKQAKISQDALYYLLTKSSGEFTEFQGKKKELKKFEMGDQLIDFVSKQGLNLQREADMQSFFEYYEQLLEGS